MKNISEILPAVKYNSIEIFDKLNVLTDLYSEMQVLANKSADLAQQRSTLLDGLINNIDVFKTILNKLETHYLIYVLNFNDCSQIKIVNFKPAEQLDYNFDKYVEEHRKRLDFRPVFEYTLTEDIHDLKIDETGNISMKHIFRKINPSYGIILKNLIISLSKNEVYFINKKEFNKNYELSDK